MRYILFIAFLMCHLHANNFFEGYVDLGFTSQQTTFREYPELNNKNLNGINMEIGFLRTINETGPINIGSAVDLTIVDNNSNLYKSYSSINFDIFKIQTRWQNLIFRAGFGTTKVYSGVNSVGWGAGIGLYHKIHSFLIGIKYRYSRMNVDNDQHPVKKNIDVHYDTKPTSVVVSYFF